MRAPSIVHVHLPQDVVVPYTINAIDGLMKALSLGTKRWSSTVTEDLLCIMLLWFRYGHLPEVLLAIFQCMHSHFYFFNFFPHEN